MLGIYKSKIIRIGNSQGIRIPKFILEQSHLGEEVELDVREDEIVIRPARRARSGWDKAFQAMASRGDDALLDADQPLSSWDEEEWEW